MPSYEKSKAVRGTININSFNPDLVAKACRRFPTTEKQLEQDAHDGQW